MTRSRAQPQASPPTDDPRLGLLCRWLESDLGFTQYEIAPASADASFRRYFRVTRAGEASVIVMDAPPGKEDVGPYLKIAGHAAGIWRECPAHPGALRCRRLPAPLRPRHGDVPAGTGPRGPDGCAVRGRARRRWCRYRRAAAPQPGSSHPTTRRAAPRNEPDAGVVLQRHLGLELTAAEQQLLPAPSIAGRACAAPAAGVRAPRLSLAQPHGAAAARIPASSISRTRCSAPVTYDLVSMLQRLLRRLAADRVDDWVPRYVSWRGRGIPAGGESGVPALVRPHGRAAPPQGQWHLRAPPSSRRQTRLPKDIPRTLQYTLDSCARHRATICARRDSRTRPARLWPGSPAIPPNHDGCGLSDDDDRAMIFAAGRGERMRPLTTRGPSRCSKSVARPDRAAPRCARGGRHHARW